MHHRNLPWIKSARRRKVYGTNIHMKTNRNSRPGTKLRLANPFCETCKALSENLECAWQAKATDSPKYSSSNAKIDGSQSLQQKSETVLDAGRNPDLSSQRVGQRFQARVPKLMSSGQLLLQETKKFELEKVHFVELRDLLSSKKPRGPKTPAPRSPICNSLPQEITTRTAVSKRCFQQKSFPPLFVWREQGLKPKRAADSTKTPQGELLTTTKYANSTSSKGTFNKGKRNPLPPTVDRSSDGSSKYSRRCTSIEIVRRFSMPSLALNISFPCKCEWMVMNYS